MNSVMNKTRLAEKPYRDKQNEKDYKNYNNQLQKTKKQQNYKRRSNMI